MNNLVLAYLGDAAYELYIREFLIASGIAKVNDLQKESLKYVSAKSQREILEHLEKENFFTNVEINIIKKGRNASGHRSKNTDIITYKKATGLECLIGQLYLKDPARFSEVMERIVGIK
ncbi:MAG: ribonuclease III domain-containing protein [Bacilli bacterium]|nr:ribonuclease III domain-containing protein [Bacilli bacterium]